MNVAETAQRALRDDARRLLEIAHAAGADAARLSMSREDGLVARLDDGRLRSAGHTGQQELRLQVHVSGRAGVATAKGQVLDEAAFVAAALEQARSASVTAHQPLPFKDQMAFDAADTMLWHPQPLSIAGIVDRAGSCFDALPSQLPGRLVSAAAWCETLERHEVVANSLGLVATRSMTQYAVGCEAGVECDGRILAGVWSESRRRMDALSSPQQVAARVAQLVCEKLDARQPASGRWRVLLAPAVTVRFIDALLGAMSGVAVACGGSWLTRRQGSAIAPPWFNLDEDPHAADGANSATFDTEGYATAAHCFVDAGVLRACLIDTAAARSLGVPPAGHCGGPRNVRVRGTQMLSWHELLEKLGDGIVVSGLMGLNLDPASGQFALAAHGQRVKGGRVDGALDDFMVHGNIAGLLAGAEALGSDFETRGNVSVGSLLVAAMDVIGS